VLSSRRNLDKWC